MAGICAVPHVSDAQGLHKSAPGLTGVLHRILELCVSDGYGAGGTDADGASGCLGIRCIPIPGKECFVVPLYAAYGPAISGDDGLRLPGT